MGKTTANIARVVVDSLSIQDTLSGDGVTSVLTATAATSTTITGTGLNVALNALAGMTIVVFSGTGSPAIRTIASNAATSAGSTAITVSTAWAVNPAAGALAQVSPSATWVNLGLLGEAPAKMDAKDIAEIMLSDGSTIQKGFNFVLSAEALQFLDAGTIEAYKNKFVWLMFNPSGSASNTVIVRNVLLQLEASADLAIKGKATLTLKAAKYVNTLADVLTIA